MRFMSRKASPQAPEVTDKITEIKAYLSTTGLSVNALACKAGTTQPSLQRFLAGDRKSVSKSAQAALDFMHNNPHSDIGSQASLSADTVLHRAVMSVWDGKPGSAVILAQLISALGPLVQTLGQTDRQGVPQ